MVEGLSAEVRELPAERLAALRATYSDLPHAGPAPATYRTSASRQAAFARQLMRRLPQNAEEAALVLQKVVRGRAARDEQEEVRRNHWLQHHYDRGEWDDALMLAVSPEERAVVIAGRDEAASLTIQKTVRARAARELVEEERRDYWLQHHFDRGEWDDALKLAISREERDVIDTARRAATPRSS